MQTVLKWNYLHQSPPQCRQYAKKSKKMSENLENSLTDNTEAGLETALKKELKNV
jgi:hypothetical protein